jgi:uncharacterized membrane protein
MSGGGENSGTDHPLERLIFFSDAVFAIAITLLVIEIHVPTPEDAAAMHGYGNALYHLLPSFAAFVLSFAVIARFWMGHHAAFSQCGRFDKKLLWPNILLLMAIAFMPFATAFLARNLGNVVPAMFYNATLLVTAVFSARLISIATTPDMLRDGADRHEVATYPTRGWAVAIAAALSLALAPFAPGFSQLPLGAIPLFRRLLAKVWGVSLR